MVYFKTEYHEWLLDYSICMKTRTTGKFEMPGLHIIETLEN